MKNLGILKKQTPSMTALQCFEASARFLSFTQAAEELHLTQSAVSKQVAQLESTLQTSLFRRVRKRLKLSPSGIVYLPEVRQILNQVEASTLHMLSYGCENEVLNVAAHPTFGARWLIPALKDFYDLYPDIYLEMRDYVQPFDLAKTGIDVAFLFGSGAWQGVESMKLFDEWMIPVCREDVLQNRAIHHVTDFSGHILIQCQSRPTSWHAYFESQSVEIDRCYQGPRFETWSACIRAAEAGYGIALVPKFMVADDLHHGRLVSAWDFELPSNGAYYLAYEEHAADMPKIKKLVAWLKEHLQLQAKLQ